MPKMDGIELLRHVLGYHPTTPVVILTAFGTIERAVEAMRFGAFDFMEKPLTDLGRLDIVLRRALQHRRLLVENQQLRGELNSRYSFDKLVGPGLKMQQIFELLATVAPTQATVLIQGESGTGKELVARAIHYNSPRAKKNFIKVNCSALPEGLIESELFGHEKGAFTGAFKTTHGKFEAADGGTLLLDEIGEMPLSLQAKLLRVLQERELQRVGSSETIKIDVRLIATTNVNLEEAVEEKKFRQDLFYRLNVIPVKLPSLADRREDIPILAWHFLRRFNKLHDRKIERISEKAMNYLTSAPWNGNVRELENAVERAVIMCRSEQIELTDFFLTEPVPVISQPIIVSISDPSQGDILTIADLEKRHILQTLKFNEGHRAKTAEILGISIRTLRNKLNEYRQAGTQI
jgi:DNA-binding NtrC family response regulator